MKSIIFTSQLVSRDYQKVLNSEISMIALSGEYIFSVYGVNEDVLELLDSNGEYQGLVAVKSFVVKPFDEINEEEIRELGFNKIEEISEYLDHPTIVTIADVIPVLADECEDCDCENCQCEGECDGNCENCDCKRNEAA